MNINNLPEDHDGVKDRSNDILFGDRSSHYDESVAHLITDYANFCTLLKETVSEAIRQVNDENKQQNLEKKLQTILTAKTISKDNKNRSRVYRDLMSEGFDLQIAMRIERTNYTNSIFNKTGDLTFETINKLIKEGKCDALFSVIRRRINNMKIDDYKKRILISGLDLVWQKLKEKDYEDNDSYVYHLLTDFIENIKGKQKLESYQSATIVNPVKELLAILDCIT